MSVLVNEVIIIPVQQAGYHLVKPPRVSPLDGAIERDGRAVSKVEGRSQRNGAILIIEPFAPLTPQDRTALAEEGMRLLAFAAADAKGHDVQFSNPA